jgi:hypothetical protein
VIAVIVTNHGETTTPPDKSLRWFLRSLDDHDMHRGITGADGTVAALCGARFMPPLTMRVVGPLPGELVDGSPASRRYPKEPSHVCPACRRAGTGR